MHPDQTFLAAIWALVSRVSSLALISFGGVNTVLPSLHHQAVNEQHWMTDRDFANMFALASVSPGPNFMVLALIGYKAAGIAGALLAVFALTLPTSLLAFAVVRVWDRFKTAHWRAAIQNGLIPVTVGFVGAAGVLLIRASDHSLAGYAITAVTAATGALTKFNPLWIFLVAAIAGAAGFVG
jgi:chromate transporter